MQITHAALWQRRHILDRRRLPRFLGDTRVRMFECISLPRQEVLCRKVSLQDRAFSNQRESDQLVTFLFWGESTA